MELETDIANKLIKILRYVLRIIVLLILLFNIQMFNLKKPVKCSLVYLHMCFNKAFYFLIFLIELFFMFLNIIKAICQSIKNNSKLYNFNDFLSYLFHFQKCPRLDDDNTITLPLFCFLPLPSPELVSPEDKFLPFLLLRVIPIFLFIDLGKFHQSRKCRNKDNVVVIKLNLFNLKTFLNSEVKSLLLF